MRGDGSSKRLSFEESRNVALLMFTCIRMLLILIYVLYKSKSLTLVTIGYSWIHSWDIFIEHCFWAQEAVCNQVIDVGTGFMKIFYLGRAPRTKETLPDFREKCRVTRHSRALRVLTGSQRTLGFWGVTGMISCIFLDMLLKVSSNGNGEFLDVRPEKFQFLEKWQNRKFDYKIVNFG